MELLRKAHKCLRNWFPTGGADIQLVSPKKFIACFPKRSTQKDLNAILSLMSRTLLSFPSPGKRSGACRYPSSFERLPRYEAPLCFSNRSISGIQRHSDSVFRAGRLRAPVPMAKPCQWRGNDRCRTPPEGWYLALAIDNPFGPGLGLPRIIFEEGCLENRSIGLLALLTARRKEVHWITDPAIWIALTTLTAFEIVLGVDNIVFISILVDKLHVHQQRKAQLIGLALAMFMRILLLFSLTWIMQLTTPLFSVLDQGISAATSY